MTRRGRSTHDFDEIVIPDRREADVVIEQLYELISKFGRATVADLYVLTGIKAAHTDHKWGWTDLRGSGVVRHPGGGYVLDLPESEILSR